VNKPIVILFLFLCLGIYSLAAQQKEIRGQITNEYEVEGIHVLNETSRLNTITDQYGKFEIRASQGDTLLVSSVKYAPQKVVVDKLIYLTEQIEITLEEFVNELDEVVLGPQLSGNLSQDLKKIKTEDKFNFDDVGIPGFKGKPQEKIVPVLGGVITPTSVNIEALYNHLSGYYKKLKLERKWDAQNVDSAKIINFYTTAFFIEAYKIPKERLYDFMLFCVETSNLQDDFKNENYVSVLSIFEEKSKIYKKRLAETEAKQE